MVIVCLFVCFVSFRLFRFLDFMFPDPSVNILHVFAETPARGPWTPGIMASPEAIPPTPRPTS